MRQKGRPSCHSKASCTSPSSFPLSHYSHLLSPMPGGRRGMQTTRFGSLRTLPKRSCAATTTTLSPYGRPPSHRAVLTRIRKAAPLEGTFPPTFRQRQPKNVTSLTLGWINAPGDTAFTFSTRTLAMENVIAPAFRHHLQPASPDVSAVVLSKGCL
jgi:hypothetical protein